MKAIEYLTEEEKQLVREYYRFYRMNQVEKASDEMRLANVKYVHARNSLQPLIAKYNVAKSGAIRRNIEWSITKEQYINLCNTTTHCCILGFELDYSYRGNVGKGKGESRLNSASLDRIDNDKGYTIDNVQIISWVANRIKNGFTEAELAEIILRGQIWAQRKLEETYVA